MLTAAAPSRGCLAPGMPPDGDAAKKDCQRHSGRRQSAGRFGRSPQGPKAYGMWTLGSAGWTRPF